MFAAGLIRQESTFQADAVSHADAIGLMQILPKDRPLAGQGTQNPASFTKNSLFDPESTSSWACSISPIYHTRSNQAARNAPLPLTTLASTASPSGSPSAPTTKFPNSSSPSPFTETREYVQIVLRNTDMYRALSTGETPKSTVSAATPAPHPLPLSHNPANLRICSGPAFRGAYFLPTPKGFTGRDAFAFFPLLCEL